jgi:hypothetical protein
MSQVQDQADIIFIEYTVLDVLIRSAVKILAVSAALFCSWANTIFCGEKSQSRTILTPYRARKK